MHIAARVSAMASGGETFVSQTVKDLISGAGIELISVGNNELKGLQDSHQIFKVV